MKKISGKLIVLYVLIFFGNKAIGQCNFPATSNCSGISPGGTSEFHLIPSPNNVDFTFDELSDYLGGRTISGSTVLKLKVDAFNASCKWKLVMYLDNNSSPGDEWETKTPYGTSGVTPEVDLIQVRVYNPCGTPQSNNVYQTFSNMVTILPIIDAAAINPAGLCNGSEVNSKGSYLWDYGEFSFTIDYRITPGLTANYKPGIYELKIRFCLVEL